MQVPNSASPAAPDAVAPSRALDLVGAFASEAVTPQWLTQLLQLPAETLLQHFWGNKGINGDPPPNWFSLPPEVA